MEVLTHFVRYLLSLSPAETQTTPAERSCIRENARGKRRLAEIGVWHGVTTSVMRAVMASDAVLWAVDPFPKGRLGFSAQYAIAHREVRRVRNGQVRWLRHTGIEAASVYATTEQEKIDFVFLDGDHSWEGLRQDWEAWAPLVSGGGLIAIHDSRATEGRPIYEAGSVRFTESVILEDIHFVLADCVDSLSVFRRLSPSELK